MLYRLTEKEDAVHSERTVKILARCAYCTEDILCNVDLLLEPYSRNNRRALAVTGCLHLCKNLDGADVKPYMLRPGQDRWLLTMVRGFTLSISQYQSQPIKDTYKLVSNPEVIKKSIRSMVKEIKNSR